MEAMLLHQRVYRAPDSAPITTSTPSAAVGPSQHVPPTSSAAANAFSAPASASALADFARGQPDVSDNSMLRLATSLQQLQQFQQQQHLQHQRADVHAAHAARAMPHLSGGAVAGPSISSDTTQLELELMRMALTNTVPLDDLGDAAAHAGHPPPPPPPPGVGASQWAGQPHPGLGMQGGFMRHSNPPLSHTYGPFLQSSMGIPGTAQVRAP